MLGEFLTFGKAEEHQWSNGETALVANVLNEERWICRAEALLHSEREERVQEYGQTPEEAATSTLAGSCH